MGADQSVAGVPSISLKSQRDEDIPYTSYSISKPIDGVRVEENENAYEDTPKQSPRLHLKTRGHSPSGRETNAGSHNPQLHDIVVVADGNCGKDELDEELKRLEEIPVFLPIMKSSLNLPNVKDADILDKIDARQMLLLCVRYQEHLKHCAEATTFDQNALCVRIKEIDFAILTLNNMVTERQKKYAKYAEQIQKVQEVSTVLTRVKTHVDELIPLMERLNSVLPPEEQLEPFVMKVIKP